MRGKDDMSTGVSHVFVAAEPEPRRMFGRGESYPCSRSRSWDRACEPPGETAWVLTTRAIIVKSSHAQRWHSAMINRPRYFVYSSTQPQGVLPIIVVP